MYCPNCKREVGGQKVVDSWSIFSVIAISAVGLLILTGFGIVITPLIVIWIIWQIFREAPLDCPICRTRLVGKGDKTPVYPSLEQASGKGFCRDCKTINPLDAKFCKNCGAELSDSKKS